MNKTNKNSEVYEPGHSYKQTLILFCSGKTLSGFNPVRSKL